MLSHLARLPFAAHFGRQQESAQEFPAYLAAAQSSVRYLALNGPKQQGNKRQEEVPGSMAPLRKWLAECGLDDSRCLNMTRDSSICAESVESNIGRLGVRVLE